MNRRSMLRRVAAIPVLSAVWPSLVTKIRAAGAPPAVRRARPSDPSWPSAASWEQLNRDVGGHLIRVRSPLAACADAADSAACQKVLKNLKNPYFIGDQPGLTQTSGWVDAWTSTPSAYAVTAESNFFESDWQRSFWGANYLRLQAVKATYDPDGLFFVHHGVGSEEWSDDGFDRLTK
jgi:hypothetical protein